MECAHCGNQVKPGFFVCAGCGAHAQRKPAIAGVLLVIFGTIVAFAGLGGAVFKHL